VRSFPELLSPNAIAFVRSLEKSQIDANLTFDDSDDRVTVVTGCRSQGHSGTGDGCVVTE
jgi:hypothetical protein